MILGSLPPPKDWGPLAGPESLGDVWEQQR